MDLINEHEVPVSLYGQLLIRLAGGTMLLFAVSFVARAQVSDNPSPIGSRYALLVGVKQYQPEGYNNTDSSRAMLSNLNTPCDDVEKIAARLTEVGWRADYKDNPEVETICDATDDQIATRIKDLVEEFDHEDRFLFVYLAGHGVQVNSRNYIFSSNAILNLTSASDRLTNNPKNVVFQGQSIELVQDLFGRAGDYYRGNILLVLDSCRNDPLYLATMSSALNNVPLTAPQISQQSDGIMVVYATTPGLRISDGYSSSYLANSLVNSIVPGRTVDSVISTVKRDVRTATRHTANPQAPERVGTLNNGNLCFAGCATAASPTVSVALADQQYSHAATNNFLRYVESHSDVSFHFGPMLNVSLGLPRFSKFLDRAKAVERGISNASNDANIDIYWCEGNEGAAREEKANMLAKSIIGAGSDIVVNESSLTRVRTRPLSREENLNPKNRVSTDTVRIDSDSPVERGWAEELRRAVPYELSVEELREDSLGYVKVYLCDGVEELPVATKLWVHVPSAESKGIGLILSDEIRRNVEGLLVEDYVDVVEVSPDKTQVRYFYDADRELAYRIADAVAPRLKVKPLVNPIDNSGLQMGPNRLELWIGKNTSARDLRELAE